MIREPGSALPQSLQHRELHTGVTRKSKYKELSHPWPCRASAQVSALQAHGWTVPYTWIETRTIRQKMSV